MKPTDCDRLTKVMQAQHSREWSPELRQHAAECSDCSEALSLAEALQDAARIAEGRSRLPDAHWIFEKAKRRTREMAVKRIARLLSAMRLLAAVYAVVAAGWLLHGFAPAQFPELATALRGVSTGYAKTGTLAALACVAAGLLLVLSGRARRRGLGSGR
jgi:predicted anti-sigma-YlaC factor YlaD